MPTETRSFATRSGRAFHKNPGGYNEFTKKAKRQFLNESSNALTQKKLVQSNDDSGAALSTKAVKKELGL